MSDLYLKKKWPFLKKYKWQWRLRKKKTEKTCGNVSHEKLIIFTRQLPIYYRLEREISIGANVDIAKTKREK